MNASSRSTPTFLKRFVVSSLRIFCKMLLCSRGFLGGAAALAQHLQHGNQIGEALLALKAERLGGRRQGFMGGVGSPESQRQRHRETIETSNFPRSLCL
jgi:hypothetical protein